MGLAGRKNSVTCSLFCTDSVTLSSQVTCGRWPWKPDSTGVRTRMYSEIFLTLNLWNTFILGTRLFTLGGMVLNVQDCRAGWLPLTWRSAHFLIHSCASPGASGGPCLSRLARQGQDQQPWPQERRGLWEPLGFTGLGGNCLG